MCAREAFACVVFEDVSMMSARTGAQHGDVLALEMHKGAKAAARRKAVESTNGQLRKRDSSSAILPDQRARTGVRAPRDTTRGGGGW